MSAVAVRMDERAIAGQSSQILTKAQVRDLILTAQTAWRVQRKLGLADEPFDAWRKAALHDACGRQSFRDVRQGEYGHVLHTLLTLAGRKPTSRPAAVKPPRVDEATRARWALDQECIKQAEAFGSYPGAKAYADSLLSRIHRATLSSATAKQLWQVLFTLRSRAKARDRVGTR